MKKAVLLPDIHHPFHNRKAVRAVLRFIKWFQPDIVVLMGDALEMRAIDHWKKEKRNLKYFENVRLLHDYQEFDKDILKPIERLVPNARKIYLAGNHEHWAVTGVNNCNPQLEGLTEPENVLRLKERGWEWIPFIGKHGKRGFIKLGKLTLVHGHYTNKYHSAKTADTYSKSTAYGHTHDIQLYTKVHVEDPTDYHCAMSIGCLCDKSPEFLWGQPNRWVHAFGIMYIRPGGAYNLYVPVIIKGEFSYAGKNFNGNYRKKRRKTS